MIYENQTVVHNEITTIAMAAYTFTSLTMATYMIVKANRNIKYLENKNEK